MKNKAVLFFSALIIFVAEISNAFWQFLSLLILYFAFLVYQSKMGDAPVAHFILFVLTCGLGGYFLYQGLKSFSLPSWSKIKRRIETKSNIERGFLDINDDTVASGDENLWNRFKSTINKQSRHLKIVHFENDLPNRDPLALRFLPVLLLCFVMMMAWPLNTSYIAHKIFPSTPFSLAFLKGEPQIIQGWITPPVYTNKAPIILNATTHDLYIIPANSVVKLSLNHIRSDAVTLDFGNQTPPQSLDKQGRSFFIETSIPNDASTVTLRDDDNDIIHAWDIFVEDDLSPTVAFIGEPTVTPSYNFGVQYMLQDDFGFENVTLSVVRAESTADEPNPEPLVFDIPVGAYTTDEDGTSYWQGQYFHDLTAHHWAGSPVFLQITATDLGGHQATTDEIIFTLPVRKFSNPLAQKLALMRGHLLDDYEGYTETALNDLEYILIRPGHYRGNTRVFLGLKSAFGRLYLDRHYAEKKSVTDLLWDIAVYIEDGFMFEDRQKIQQAQSELMKALSDPNADMRDIENLMNAYQQAIEQMMQNAMRDMMEKMQNGDVSDIPAMQMDPQAFEKFMQTLKDMVQSGDRDAAMKMLQEMEQAMQNMGQEQQLSEEQKQGLQQLKNLNEIIKAQEALLEETKRLEAEASQSQTDAEKQALNGECQNAGSAQSQLADMTEKTHESLSTIMPNENMDSLKNAQDHMDQAAQSLKAQNFAAARDAQQKALEALQQGMDDAMQGMESALNMSFSGPSMPGMMGMGTPMPQNRGQNTDPFGRENGNANPFSGSLDYKDGQNLQKSREIIDELRRRSGERFRPQQELDYIQRLLERF